MDIGGLKEIDAKTMSSLKDFQCATVERVSELFTNGQTRVLVADEVGLGKTLIARGVISKTAIKKCESGADIFKIVYICSNQVIAKQNIRKLDVFDVCHENVADDSRLSMQHLKISKQEMSTKQSGEFAQLIPLTPTTSFSMTNGGGSRNERALMLAILQRVPKLKDYIDDIGVFMSQNVNRWEEKVDGFRSSVEEVEKSNIGYPDNIIKKIFEYDRKTGILDSLITHVKERKHDRRLSESGNSILRRLRVMFAEISVSMLNPDLVIMDEFQRFKYLIDSDEEETENGMIAKTFFKTPNLKVLLLSATPYKLYSTIEEVEDSNDPDEFYKEFIQVIEFLTNDKLKMNKFSEVWSKYSVALRELLLGDAAVLNLKYKAEEEMYKLMCRTERIAVMNSGDFIDDKSTKSTLKISEGDIHTYMDMGKMLESIGEQRALLVDYAKSTPYLMSYMNHYKIKEYAESYFEKHNNGLPLAESDYLWVNRDWLEHYGEVKTNNARLEELKRIVFQNRSELFMWVPPSCPYYRLEGPYKESEGFSKILVFSSWEMVPKMIGSLISYEEERRTVGLLSNAAGIKTANNTYFTESKLRYPAGRLRFNVSKGEARGMYMFCLLYPSDTLSEIYHPIEYLNEGYSLKEIRGKIKSKLSKLMNSKLARYAHSSVREDRRWYYMAPVLLDGIDYANEWINIMSSERSDDDESDERGVSGFETHLRQMESLIGTYKTALGRPPADLLDVLADMAIGSFAVCAYRSNGGDIRMASELAKVFINRFNSTEATAAVMLSYSDNGSLEGDGHWKNVLRYCCDGGFGAMLDEYIHMISEGTGFGLSDNKNREVHEAMIDALKIHSASYRIDTYPAFCNRMKCEEYQITLMRSHYAVGYTKSDGEEATDVKRKESLRNAFNSPMRPFVLATTSIGQEGLDFHYYCRKIMHWNLPSNPIDLEQREGRINRYKCLAIRQDLAKRYADRKYNTDIWQEIFEMAADDLRADQQSEMVPFWCLGKKQIVKIERIVPMFPVSKDDVNYQRLIKVLSLYRLTMGQTRQEELVNYFLESGSADQKFINDLFIELSPYSRKDADWKRNARSRQPVVAKKKKSARQRQIEELQARRSMLEQQYKEIETEEKTLKKYPVVNMKVHHKLFGDGIIKEFKDKRVLVVFNGEKKYFSMPSVFYDGFLISEHDDFVDDLKRRLALIRKKKSNKEELERVQQELESLVI